MAIDNFPIKTGKDLGRYIDYLNAHYAPFINGKGELLTNLKLATRFVHLKNTQGNITIDPKEYMLEMSSAKVTCQSFTIDLLFTTSDKRLIGENSIMLRKSI
jgi:hypothetical protein